jgi:Secretion system C-terminal sorting domain
LFEWCTKNIISHTHTHSGILFGKKTPNFTSFSFLFYYFILLLPLTTMAQTKASPNVEWDFTSSGTVSGFAKDDNWATKPLALPDGNFIIAGFSDEESTGRRYPAVFKLNPANSGRIVWETLPHFNNPTSPAPPLPASGTGGFQDVVAITDKDGLTDNKIFAVGYYFDANTNRRVPFITLLDYNGAVIYAKELILNNTIQGAELQRVVLDIDPQTEKVSVFIGGQAKTLQTANRPLVCKVDPLTGNLDKTWANGAGFVNFAVPIKNVGIRIHDFIKRKDGGFVLAGSAINDKFTYPCTPTIALVDKHDAYLAGLNANGLVEWQKTFTEDDMENTINYVDIDANIEVPLCPKLPQSVEVENEQAYGIRESEVDNEFVVSCRFDFVFAPICAIAGCSPFSTQQDQYFDCDMAVIKFKINDAKTNIDFLYGKDAGRSIGLDFYNPLLKVDGRNEYHVLGATSFLPITSNTKNGLVLGSVVKVKDDGTKFDVEWRKDFKGRADLYCPFGFTYSNDGGIVSCGNNEKNGDDYEVIKLGNNCQNEYGSYTDNGNITINTDTNWESDKTVKGLIRVQSGNTLTIKNCTIEFANTYLTNDMSVLAANAGAPTKVIVEKGAALVLDHCILKGFAACGNDERMWEGIEVLGDPNLSANSTNQGTIRLINDAQIMNSYYGICAGSRVYNQNGMSNPTGFDGGGGVRCNNPINSTVPHFLNNRFSVWFAPYFLNYGSYSISNFNNTNFVCDAPMLDVDYVTASGERMGSNQMLASDSRRNIRVINCNFKGYKNPNWVYENPIVECQGRAVSVFNANFTFDNCKFTDFDFGIYASYAASFTKPTYVYNSTFTRVHRGVNLLGGAFHIISKSNFVELLDGNMGDASYGIRMEAADASTVYNNCTFKAFSSNVNAIGIVETSTGANASLIKDCNFDLIQRGVQTEQGNSGLQIRCNSFTENRMAWSINPINVGSISDQGECGLFEEQAGNLFQDNNCPVNEHINSSLVFRYNHRNITQEIPTCNVGSVFINKCNDENPKACETIPDCPNPPCSQALQFAISNATGWKKENLESQLLGQLANNLSDEIVLSDLLQNATYQENLGFMRVSALIDENKWAAAETLLYSLPSVTTYDAEMIKIFSIVLNTAKVQLSVRNISEEQEIILQDIATYSTTNAKYHAQAILEVKNDMNYERPVEEWTKVINKAVKNPIKSAQNQSFSIIPNPSNTFVKISTNGAVKETTNVELIDIQGRIVLNTKILAQNSSIEIDVSRFVSGIYFVKISNPTTIELQKILVSH